MKVEAINKYLAIMSEIKRRESVIEAFQRNMANAVFKATTVESVYLQFRKIIELIALSSLVANKEVYSAAYANFAKHWNAELMIKDLARINPKFYPQPIIIAPSKTPGIKSEWTSRKGDFLNEDDLIKLYGKCAAILHAENPYGSKIDYDYYQKEAIRWTTLIRNLLNAHKMTLVNDPDLYLIQMGTVDKPPTYNSFRLATPGDNPPEVKNSASDTSPPP